MLTLYLSAVDSRYATPDELEDANIRLEDLPPHFRRDDGTGMMAHQAHTIAALRRVDAPIVINTAMTGDGKSFVGQFLTYIRERNAMTLYPTNELAKDQERSLNALKTTWKDGGIQRMRFGVVNAAILDEVQSDLIRHTRSQVLKNMLDNELVLTNPDIFHLIMQFGYRVRGAAADYLFKEVVNRFNLFTFDEFHVFSAPQAISAVIAMLTILEATHNQKTAPRFLFLSATSGGTLSHLAKLAGLEVEEIEGDYAHGEPTPAPDRRRILQPATLHLYERGEGGLEAWVQANIDHMLAFFREHPEAHGVILCNSVATAFRVHAFLKDLCVKAGIDLGEPNTGLTLPQDRRIDAQLFVATSTVDLGVDFKINFLVFESIDYATHIQRLGRLGRHAQNAQGEHFSAYEAHGLLPGWVLQHTAQTMPDGSSVNREQYKQTLKDGYGALQEFHHYRLRWGGVQAARVLNEMKRPEIKSEYNATRERLYDRFKTLFPSQRMHPNNLRALYEHTPAIGAEASSFRGTSPFTALVVNGMRGRDDDEKETVLSYNLTTLLMQAVLEPISLDEAYRRAGNRAEALRKTEPLIAYRVIGWLPQKPRRLSILLNERTSDWSAEFFGTVIEQRHFRFNIEPNDIPEIRALNETLEDRALVSLLIRPGDMKNLYNADPAAIRLYFRLGLSLELFSFTSVDGASSGCAAFGRDALLLDSLIYHRKSDVHDPMFG